MPTYPQAVITDGAVGYWRLGEPSGNALDSSGNGLAGTVVGGVTRGQTGALLIDTNGAMLFNGSTGQIDLPTLAVNAAFTIEAWIKTTASGQQAFFSTFSGVAGVYAGSSSGFPFLFIAGAGGFFAGSTGLLSDGIFHHVAYTNDGTTSTAYVDGVQIGGALPQAHAPEAALAAAIAYGMAGSPDHFSGTIDEVAIYPTALSAARIAAHFALRVPDIPPVIIYLRPALANPYDIELRDPTQNTTPLSADARLAIATVGAVTATASFAATAGLEVSTDATVIVGGPLLADAAIAVATDAQLALEATLAATSALAVASTPPFLSLEPTLSAAPQLQLATTPPRLETGALTFAAEIALALTVAPPFLRMVADLASSGGVRVATAANLVLTGPSAFTTVVAFNGALVDTVRLGSVTIRDELNDRPNACDFIVDVAPPAVGTDVKIGLLNLLAQNLIFAGTVLSVTQNYFSDPAIPSWTISCRDYTFLINRRKVLGTWKDVSATAVATEILTKYTTGFSGAGIAAGLPAISLTLHGVDTMKAMTQVAADIGGYCDVSPAKVFKLFLTSSDPAPNVIDGLDPLLQQTPPLQIARDLSQVRTRVFLHGRSAAVVGPSESFLPIGTSTIPIDDATPFSSGRVITEDSDILTYAGTTPGEVSSIAIGNVGSPDAPPVPTLAAGIAGGLSGTYWWAVAFGTGDGETPVGPVSQALFAPDVAAPATGVGLGGGTGQGIGPLVGLYRYQVAFVTSLGETLPGPAVARTANALAPPPAPNVQNAAGAGPLLIDSLYRYAVTFVTAYGETALGGITTYAPTPLSIGGFTSDPFTFGGILGGPYFAGMSIVTAQGESPMVVGSVGTNHFTGAPSQPVYTGIFDTFGRIAPGPTYFWACSSYHDEYGETPLSGSTSTTTFGSSTLRFRLNLPPLPGNASGVRLYRAMAGTTFKLVAEFVGTPPSQYLDAQATEELGSQYPKDSRRAGVRLRYNATQANEVGVLARRFYRTKAGLFEFFLVGEIQNNFSGQSVIDLLADSQLTSRNPATGSAGTTGRFCQVSLPFGNAGILARRIYRTKANQSTFYLVGEVKDNQTATWLDGTPDSGLTVSAPGLNTAGGDKNFLSSIPLGPAGTLARQLYRTKSGGSEFFELARLSNNVVTTFVDDVPDATLGGGVQLQNTAGSSAVRLLNVPIGQPGVTQRVIYRTIAGGATTDLRYVGTLNDNSTTQFVDDRADSALGRGPQATSTIGALAGNTSIALKSVAGFPQEGWVRAGNQLVHYTDLAFTSLVGIPPLIRINTITRSGSIATVSTLGSHGFPNGQAVTILGTAQPEYNGTQTITVTSSSTFTFEVKGLPVSPATSENNLMYVGAPGALVSPVAGGTVVTTIPQLTFISLVRPIKVGARIALWVQRDSITGQQQLAALEGGDGVHEYVIEDDGLDSVAACNRRGDAELQLFQFAKIDLKYWTRDPKSKSGVSVHVDLPAPQNLTGDFLIQTVTISQLNFHPRTFPLFEVSASNSRFSLEDLLRRVADQL